MPSLSEISTTPLAESTMVASPAPAQPTPSPHTSSSPAGKLDHSFRIDQGSFQEQDDLHEDTLDDPMPTVLDTREIDTDFPPIFRLVDDASQRGKPKLVDTIGYSYSMKQRRGTTTYWACSVRNKKTNCTASVIEKAGAFTAGKTPNCHQSLPGLFTTTEIGKELLQFATTPDLLTLMEYVQATWLESLVWCIRSRSVFGLSLRTNNDVEGWHRRLNCRAGRGNIQFYVLLSLLFREAEMVNIQIRLVSEGKLKRVQRKSFRDLQGKNFKLSEAYMEGSRTASQLLRGIGELNSSTS